MQKLSKDMAGYGNTAKMSANPAPDMKKESMKEKMPMKKMGMEEKFEGGKSSGLCYSHDRKSSQ
jgi:hypothetical protein